MSLTSFLYFVPYIYICIELWGRFSKLNRCSNLNKHDFVGYVAGTIRRGGDWIDRINLCMITMQHFKSKAAALCILFVGKVFGDSSGFSTFSRVSRVWHGSTNYRGGSMIGSVPFILSSGMVKTARRRSAQIKLYCWDILMVKVICIKL